MFKFTNFTDGEIFHTSSSTFRSMTSKGKTILKTGKTVQKIESPIKTQVESAVNLNLTRKVIKYNERDNCRMPLYSFFQLLFYFLCRFRSFISDLKLNNIVVVRLLDENLVKFVSKLEKYNFICTLMNNLTVSSSIII